MDTQQALSSLVLSLDDDEGINEQGYLAIRQLVANVWNEQAVVVLDASITITENRFYFENTAQAQECLSALEESKDDANPIEGS